MANRDRVKLSCLIVVAVGSVLFSIQAYFLQMSRMLHPLVSPVQKRKKYRELQDLARNEESRTNSHYVRRFRTLCPDGERDLHLDPKTTLESPVITETEVETSSDMHVVTFHVQAISNDSRMSVTPSVKKAHWFLRLIHGSGQRISRSFIIECRHIVIKRMSAFSCAVPRKDILDLSRYVAALVYTPCERPAQKIDLSEIRPKEHSQKTDVTMAALLEEAPPWHIKSTFLYSSPAEHPISANQCLQKRVKYDVTTPPSDPDWLTIEEHVTYVYSAHVDIRESGGVCVKGFGLVNKKFVLRMRPFQLYCQLFLRGSKTPLVAAAEVEDILGGRRLPERAPKYRDVIYICRFKDLQLSDLIDPILSYVTQPCSPPGHFLRVTVPVVTPEHDAIKRDFTVCLSGPVNSGYDDVHRFVEWMELNTILGADHFVVYDHDSGDAIRTYFDHYTAQGKLDVFRFDAPKQINYTNNDDVWYYGQRVFINDCLYRNMFKTKYMVYVDLDEVIAPKSSHLSWKSMMTKAGCTNSAYTMALNVLFRTEWPDDTQVVNLEIVKRLKLLSLLKTYREQKIYSMNKRAKYIIQPTTIDLLLVHRPFPRDVEKVDPCILAPDVGLLHHYREPLPDARKETVASGIVDRSLHKMAVDLVKRTYRVHILVQRPPLS